MVGYASQMAGRRALNRSAFLVLALTFILTLESPKTYTEFSNNHWSLCKALNLDREWYQRFISRNSTQRYSRFISARNSTRRYYSMEAVAPILKVESGPCLFDTTLVALYLLLLAGDICENPGPETRSVGGEMSNLLNIPVVISNGSNNSRPFHRPVTGNLASIPIVNEQYRCPRRYLRICCLNARSIKNKSADFACYANSTGADIFATTESWLSERDMAH